MSHSGIRLLTLSDIPAAMRLKEAARWNQTAADWERLLVVEPEGCVGLEQEGVLAATATAVTYGTDLAWIGMVLTLPEYRGRGFARRLMGRVVEFADARSVAVAGLDATDMGISLYREFGFEADCLVERWEHPGGPGPVGEGLDPWTPDPDLDISAFGTDRGGLLAALAPAGAVSIPGLGYAMARPGSLASYFGPCVARSADAAGRLLGWFLARHPDGPRYWDIPERNRQAIDLARESGFRPVRRLTRMYRRARPGWQAPDGSKVFAIAGFEYG